MTEIRIQKTEDRERKKTWVRKDLLSVEELSKEEIKLVLDTAESFKEVSSRDVKKVPALRGKTIANLFFEPSTRTRTSFELAAKRLSADIINFSASGSSTSKGESLSDTAKNIEAMHVDTIVMRHPSSGSAEVLSRCVKAGIVNAGDGIHEHPTQGLLDLFTIREKKKNLEGIRVCLVGDILHSRVARSNIWGLVKMGAKVTVCGPPTLIPAKIEELGVEVCYDLDKAVKDQDVLNILRIQLERQRGAFFPSIREYAAEYGISSERLKKAKPDVVIMHPGPVNRGVELSSAVADGKHSVILDQVTNGVAIRMAVLFLTTMVDSDPIRHPEQASVSERVEGSS
ncbi:MAG: aspartate carbamoyltransferase catalytic subunit [Candidatus Omnitrophica bacterium]|nr:aspartate carbamoyltransferase catalytic subunit [Candidatus Omnitrophota bacterium]